MGYLDAEGLSRFWEKVRSYVDEHGSSGVPVGSIVIWSGTEENIPEGWALCDGQDGRPDLRDKFVLGAGESHAVGDSGGSEEVTLTVEQMPKHSHNFRVKGPSFSASSTLAGTDEGLYMANSNWESSLIYNTGGSKPHPNMPPYYALCYIIKITEDGGASGEGGGAAGEIYSTEETRIGTWIDGKPLYRKTFSFVCPTAKNTWQKIIDCDQISVDVLTKSNIFVRQASGNCIWANHQSPSGILFLKMYNANSKEISLYTTASDANDQPAFAILEYTKTTD